MLRQVLVLLISKVAAVVPQKSDAVYRRIARQQRQVRDSKCNIAALDYSTADMFSNHLHVQVFSGVSLARELNSLPKWAMMSRIGQPE